MRSSESFSGKSQRRFYPNTIPSKMQTLFKTISTLKKSLLLCFLVGCSIAAPAQGIKSARITHILSVAVDKEDNILEKHENDNPTNLEVRFARNYAQVTDDAQSIYYYTSSSIKKETAKSIIYTWRAEDEKGDACTLKLVIPHKTGRTSFMVVYGDESASRVYYSYMLAEE